MRVARESEQGASPSSLWLAALSTFISKFILALSFVIPVLLLPLSKAMWASLAWGLLILILLSYFVERSQKSSPAKTIGEHVLIALIVVVITHYTGIWIARTFNESTKQPGMGFVSHHSRISPATAIPEIRR